MLGILLDSHQLLGPVSFLCPLTDMRERSEVEGVSRKVQDWVEHCTRYLDFVWGREEDFPPLTVSEALQGPAQLKICDPFGYMDEPPLCKK